MICQWSTRPHGANLDYTRPSPESIRRGKVDHNFLLEWWPYISQLPPTTQRTSDYTASLNSSSTVETQVGRKLLLVHFLILTVTFSPRLNNAHANTHFVYIFHQPHYQDRDIIFPIFYQFTHLSLAGRVRSEFFEYSPFGPDVYVTNVVDRPLR